MSNSDQPQGVFSFFDDVEKTDAKAGSKRSVLRPPQHIEEKDAEAQDDRAETDLKQEEGLIVAEALVSELSTQLEEAVVVEAPTVDFETAEEVQDPVIKKAAGVRGRRSVKENSAAADLVEMPDDEELFKKQYYSMGEVTTMFNENHSLIRYWESEFDILKPKKNGKGDRFFRPVDVKNLYLIYDLLRRRKFTIEGAREYLKNSNKAEEKFNAVQSLERIKSFFLELKATL